MSENRYQGKIYSFIELLNNNIIEIPIIQRDYAQGRKDKKEIRGNFLAALYDSLQSNSPIMLDFIYGSIVNENFQPLDGQQRLTTLYLLHWYASNKDEVSNEMKSQLNRFTYETRITSRDFCSALILNSINIKQDAKISTEIIDSPWFFLSWKSDPTIDAMLRTIDDIHKRFFDVENLWERLNNDDQNLIKFYHVELENIGLTDDLYIKMNARGKLLTSFENFKAGFEKYIIDKKWEDNLDHLDKFALQIDSFWTDFFWTHFKKSNNVDDAFMRFISTVSMIRMSIDKTKKSEETIPLIGKLQDDFNNVKPEYFEEEDFKYLVECLHLYSKEFNDLIKDTILDFPFWRHEPKHNILDEVVFDGSGASYSQKVLFFAQVEYFRKTKEFDLQMYRNWMRVVRNIVSRGDVEKSGKRPDIVRSPQTFYGVINLISELSEGCSNIYTHLSELENLKSTFAKDQVEEERKKAKLILGDNEIKDSIHLLEDTDLLRGKIDFIFYCIDYNESFDKELFLKTQIVFCNHFGIEKEISNDLRRALLTIEVDGEYEFYKDSDKRCLIDKFREIEHYISTEFRAYFKQLLLRLIDKSLKDIVDEFNKPDNFPNWKYRLIKEPKLLDDSSKSNYIAILGDDSCCYLLKSKRPRDAQGCIKVE